MHLFHNQFAVWQEEIDSSSLWAVNTCERESLNDLKDMSVIPRPALQEDRWGELRETGRAAREAAGRGRRVRAGAEMQAARPTAQQGGGERGQGC